MYLLIEHKVQMMSFISDAVSNRYNIYIVYIAYSRWSH